MEKSNAPENLEDVRKAVGLFRAGKIEKAYELCSALIDSGNEHPVVLRLMGDIFFHQDNCAAAMDFYTRTLHVADKDLHTLVRLCCCLRAIGQYEQAQAIFVKSAGLASSEPATLEEAADMAMLYESWSLAITWLRQALTKNSDFIRLRLKLSHALIMAGDFAEGFKEQEQRKNKDRYFYNADRHYKIPLWDGSALKGASVLLICEQTPESLIMFVRHAKRLQESGAAVYVECPEKLANTLARVDGVDEVYTPEGALPHVDTRAYAQSLPFLFRTRPDTIYNPGAYIRAGSDLTAELRRRVGRGVPGGHTKVAIIEPDEENTRFEKALITMEPGTSATFFLLPSYASLGANRADRQAGLIGSVDMRSEIFDIEEMIAVLSLMDYVVGIPCPAMHLAGAMGKKGQVVVDQGPHWHWLVQGNNCPWYPSLEALYSWNMPQDKLAAKIYRGAPL